MNHIVIRNEDKNKIYTIAILCPAIRKSEIKKHYYNPYLASLDEDVMVCDLFIDKTKKKTSAADIKEFLNDLIPNLLNEGIKLLIVTQPEYFKVLTRQTKTDTRIGDIIETRVVGLYATYCPHYSRIFYDPIKIQSKIQLAMNSVVRWKEGDTSPIGKNIIKFSKYPKTNRDIINWLDKLLDMDCDLTIDVECFSLKHYDAGIGTITFCWSETEGIAFPIDYIEYNDPNNKEYGKYVHNYEIRKALVKFFLAFKKKAIYHNICFDVYILIHQLFMRDILDQKGLLFGLKILLANWDCSQLITYLATNSCAGNELGLKAQAQDYAGNYAVDDIKDIKKIPLDKLLKYNLIDGLSTWNTFNKNEPIVIADNQMGVYNSIFKPAVSDVIQMQLSGIPINMDKVKKLDILLNRESKNLQENMDKTSIVINFLNYIKSNFVINKNKSYKKKIITINDQLVNKIIFNPNSPKQLQELLYSEDFLGLPVLDYTDTKLPATGADTLEKLKFHTKDQNILNFLDMLIEFKASAVIISTFLPAFLLAKKGKDGWHYLFGNFRLGGTKSGRLSSNNPNLTNIPSSGSTKFKQKLAKLIKECVEAPLGWLFVGLDFDSLEDKISAVTTKDPNKIKVYSDGYDGHCLRAQAYFPDEMLDIELCPDGNQSYKAMINNKSLYFHENEIINYQGEKMTGLQLYKLLG